MDDIVVEARQLDEAKETASWKDEWERLNAEREAMESFLSVPSYFERYEREKLNREALAQVE